MRCPCQFSLRPQDLNLLLSSSQNAEDGNVCDAQVQVQPGGIFGRFLKGVQREGKDVVTAVDIIK